MSAKILLVEDNATNRYLATFLLESGGFVVVHAATGAEALGVAAAQKPDVILMDIQMPEIDGYQATQQLKRVPELAAIPVVAVTSYAMAGDRAKAMEMGFAGYIEKPIATETFVQQVSQFLAAKAVPV